MFTRNCLMITLLAATPTWGQVSVEPGGGAPMSVPPPVSSNAYPTTVGSETRSNYLRAGVILNTAYSDNVVAASGPPVSDFIYTIYPTIGIDKATQRLRFSVTYSPGFTFYQPTSFYNQSTHDLVLNAQYRLSPHVTVSLRDSLLKTSQIFNQPNSFSGGAVSGSPQAPFIAVLAPAALLGNVTNVDLTYQFDKNSMFGVAGTFTVLNYLQGTSTELYDSNSSGASAFYSHRLSKNHYIGATYQYSKFEATAVNGSTSAPGTNARSDLNTQSVFLFYTIFVKTHLSFSFSGGPEYFNVVEFPYPPYASWSPTFTGSMSWQERHSNFAASYSRIIAGGGGLLGAFESNNVNVSARAQFSRTWFAGLAAGYSNNKDVTPSSFQAIDTGHVLFGTVSAEHQLSERLNIQFGYTHSHQTYSHITAISNVPNTNREFVSLSYQLTKPLGR
jgi:hypothetical protein